MATPSFYSGENPWLGQVQILNDVSLDTEIEEITGPVCLGAIVLLKLRLNPLIHGPRNYPTRS
jgi:hypothetical protein